MSARSGTSHFASRIRLAAFVFAFGLTANAPLALQAQTVTELLRNGPNAEKYNLVIIGDGFQAGADQTTYNNFVQNTVIRDLFSESRDGAYREIMGAFNIFRINADSAQSGITTVDANGNVTANVNTFLGYRFTIGCAHRPEAAAKKRTKIRMRFIGNRTSGELQS